MVEIADPVDAALLLAETFEKARISYAMGGALALGIWGVPRGTNDVDVNVFVPIEALSTVFDSLRSIGISLDDKFAEKEAREQGMFVAHLRGIRVDIFVPSIDFAWEAARTKLRQKLVGREVDVLSAEALAVFKLLFFRPQDLADLESMVAVQGQRLDVKYVRANIIEAMGADDPRVLEWDRIVRDFGK